MKGMPIQLPTKLPPAKAEVGSSVVMKGANNSSNFSDSSKVKSDFSALFEGLTGSGNTSEITPEINTEIKSENGETLKNLLALKSNDQIIEQGNGQVSEEQESVNEEIVLTDPKQVEAFIAALAAQTQTVNQGNSTPAIPTLKTNESLEVPEFGVEKKITKTSNNLEQLLNTLKGTQENYDVNEEVGEDSLQNVRGKIQEKTIKGELKTENPLEFLINGSNTKGASINIESKEPSDIESLLGQKKMMTGEDYLKNMESSEKKISVKTPQVNVPELVKNTNQNVKAYGQGLTLLSDPLIKNTKDLAFKDGNKGKHASIDELRTPDMKIGAELSTIKQDVIPMMQNKENHTQQSETQTNTNQKVLDLGKINTANTTEIIRRISDYVEQNTVANKSSLDLTVKHDSLGEFKIQVTKTPNQTSNLIDMQITTSSKEGQDFFVKNEVSLMKNLNNAGINLSDFRIVSTMSDSTFSGQTDSRQSNSQQNQDSSSKQFMSFDSGNTSSDSSNGKNRRKELWEEYQQRYGA